MSRNPHTAFAKFLARILYEEALKPQNLFFGDARSGGLIKTQAESLSVKVRKKSPKFPPRSRLFTGPTLRD